MPDVFISYSRRDKEHALSLAERLRASGCSIWIDTQGIEAATSWSREIVTAIDTCKAVLLLLSESSVASHNVVKEVSLASESRKTILPVDLEHVDLTADLRYQLAGLQRVKYADFDAILRGLDRIGAISGATVTPPKPVPQVAPKDDRVSLAVLPFEDLSAGKDNEWFADGLADELINALSSIESLRVTDRRTAMGYKGYKGSLQAIAQALNVRYCIEGAVRKHGEQIKITVALYDSRSTEYIWNEAHRGVMDDIFDIQEAVAKKTIEALKVTLSLADQEKLETRPTQNVEAYELYLRALEYQERNTRKDWVYAIELITEALRLDPQFATALAFKALVHCLLYRVYDPSPQHIQEAGALIDSALALEPNLAIAYFALCTLEGLRGNLEAALVAGHKIIEIEPNVPRGYFSIGHVYAQFDDPAHSAIWYRRAVEINPASTVGYWNLYIQHGRIADTHGIRTVAREALQLFERRLKLSPDDQFIRIGLANFYVALDRFDDAAALIHELADALSTDSVILYNLACLYVKCGKHSDAIRMLRRALETGFSNRKLLHSDPDLDPLRDLPEFEAILKKL